MAGNSPVEFMNEWGPATQSTLGTNGTNILFVISFSFQFILLLMRYNYDVFL